jgi:PAS domain S-box-containing protein
MASSTRSRISSGMGYGDLPSILIVGCVVTTLSYLAPRIGGALISYPQMVWPLWPSCAILVSGLLLVPLKIWPILIPVAFAGFCLYDLQVGVPVRSIAWFILADTVQVLIAALGLRYSFPEIPRLNSIKALAKYSLFAVILAPFAAAFISALGIGGDYWRGWRICFFSEVLSFVTLTPAILTWIREGPAWVRKSRAYHLEAAALTAGLALLGYIAFTASTRNDSPALLYSLVPFLLWSALRFGSIGVSTSMVVVTFLSIWGSVHGRGPFTEQTPHSMLPLQLFLVFAATPFMVLAAVVEDHKHASGELALANDRLLLAMEAGTSMAWDLDVRSGRDCWFGNLQTIFGIPSDTHVAGAQDFIRYVHPADRARVSQAFADARQDRKLYAPEFRIVRRDGMIRWLVARGKFYYASDDEAERMLGVSLDITERKLAEGAVRESENRYRRIVETASEGIWLLDSNLHTSYVNRQMAEMMGYDPAQMMGESVFNFYFPEDFGYKKQVLERRQQGVREQIEERLRRRDGSELWVRMAAIPVYKDNGEFDGALAMVADITERKQTEAALRESEERFRLVANTAPVLIWMSGPDKLCTYFNKPWLDFTGRSIESELGNGWAAGVHPDDLARCMDTYTQAFDRREEFRMEYRLRRHDGEYRWVLDIGIPRFDPDRSLAGYIGSCIDVTDRKLAEETLAGVSRRLIEAQEQERTRIARELHDDFAQRLALLAIGLEQLHHEFPALHKVGRRVGELRKQTTEIAFDIQTLSHELHSAKLQYLGMAAAMRGFCQEFGEHTKVRIDFKSHNLPSNLSPDLSLCLFRVLQEALRNSARHSGVALVEVHLWATSDEIHLKISDAGTGFDRTAARESSGLGLISMEERLKVLKGTFSIDSQPNRGTTIHARVPLGGGNDFMRAAG